jgi:hypothetical protein
VDAFKNAFSDNPVKVEIPTTDEKPEEPVTSVETLDPPEEPAGSSPAPEEKSEPEKSEEPSKREETVPHEALHAERKRRQELEARLAELEKKPKTSVLEDEDKAFQERLAEHSRPLVQKLFNMSVAAAKRVPGREDYQTVYDFMEREVQSHPELMQAINDADDPGEYIYQLGRTRKELAEVGGDFARYREKIAAEKDAKLTEANKRIAALEAELGTLKASKEKREAIPQSLNAEQSGAVKGDTFAGPTPLRSVFQSN